MADRHLTLTPQQALLIIHALQAVAPSGGGSPAFHLATWFQNQTNLEPDWLSVGKMQQTICNDVLDNELRASLIED